VKRIACLVVGVWSSVAVWGAEATQVQAKQAFDAHWSQFLGLNVLDQGSRAINRWEGVQGKYRYMVRRSRQVSGETEVQWHLSFSEGGEEGATEVVCQVTEWHRSGPGFQRTPPYLSWWSSYHLTSDLCVSQPNPISRVRFHTDDTQKTFYLEVTYRTGEVVYTVLEPRLEGSGFALEETRV
jgi:hypothetical protein